MRCARRLSKLRFSSVSGGTADVGKNMRATRPQTPRQVKVTCTPANKFAVIVNKNSLVQIQRTCTRIFSGKSMKSAIQTQNRQTGKKNGANHRIRTDDLLITNELLYRLS